MKYEKLVLEEKRDVSGGTDHSLVASFLIIRLVRLGFKAQILAFKMFERRKWLEQVARRLLADPDL